MNKLNSIIERNKFEIDRLYLLEKPNENFGFFIQNNVIYFGKKSTGINDCFPFETNFLSFYPHIFVQSISLNSSFETGYYDLLAYKGNYDDLYFDVFYNVCTSYCFDNSGLEFYDFFQDLAVIFSNAVQSKLDLIGLVGELLFIKYIYENYKYNLSHNWHLLGNNSKFDFSLEKFNIEVKTSTKDELKFLIKHDQIFNNQNNYIVLVSLINSGNGFSLKSIISYFQSMPNFSNDVKFQIALSNAFIKFKNSPDFEMEFSLESIKLFFNADMNTIVDIPPAISKIEYEYNFADIPEISFSTIFGG